MPGDDFPRRIERAEFGVNPLLACLPFRLVHLYQFVETVVVIRLLCKFPHCNLRACTCFLLCCFGLALFLKQTFYPSFR